MKRITVVSNRLKVVPKLTAADYPDFFSYAASILLERVAMEPKAPYGPFPYRKDRRKISPEALLRQADDFIRSVE